MARLFISSSLVVLLIISLALALEVAPGSSCATFCLDDGETDAFDPNSSSTNSSDIICRDLEFSTEDKGIKFKACLECLSKSKKVDDDDNESDLHWYLYNLRYSLSTCLFSTPQASSDSQIDSPCVIDHACRPLEDPLTEDNLDANQTETYSYCDASDGNFSGKSLTSCISCLRASSEQTYLSNFLVALQAGCEQKPDPGELINLSGTVFTTSSVNITEPAVDVTSKPKGAGSNTLTTGAIVGIAVGVGLLFIGGVALFFIYRRRQKILKRNEKSGYDDNAPYAGTPDPILPPDGNQMSSSIRSYSQQSHYGKGPSMTSGEYYDKLEEEIHGGPRVNYNFDPRSKSRGPNSAIPAHQAYIPRAVSRLVSDDSTGSSTRTASPPAAPRGHSRSNTAGSFALQTYLNSDEPSPPAVPQVNVQPPPASRRTASVDRSSILPGPPPRPPPKQERRTPSLALPSLRKMRRPKQYAPPTVESEEATRSELQISQPVMNLEARFTDRPLQGGTVYATEGRIADSHKKQYDEVPMRSGKSTLYG